MAKVFPGRYTAEVDGDFVVFPHRDADQQAVDAVEMVADVRSMIPMLKSLRADADKGLLGARLALVPGLGPTVIQYWRSVSHLDRFAKDAADKHSPMQHWFNTKVGYDGDVGIWHETYIVRAGDYEAICGSMPKVGQPPRQSMSRLAKPARGGILPRRTRPLRRRARDPTNRRRRSQSAGCGRR